MANPLPQPVTVYNWALARNLFIIAVLIVAIAGTWRVLRDTRAARAEENARTQARVESIEREAREEAARLAEEARAEAEARRQASAEARRETPEVSPAEESTSQALSRLRPSLVAGDRSEFPAAAKERAGSVYLVGDEPTSWDEAQVVAENHGAQLAIPTSDEDLEWLAGLASDEDLLWIGAGRAGRDAWSTLDGRPWRLEQEPIGAGNAVAIGALGLPRATAARTRLRPVLHWPAEGRPATLERALETARESFAAGEPVFPAGTVRVGSGHYLVVVRFTDWQGAAELAAAAGGHLAVPSDLTERATLAQLAEATGVEYGIWLGAWRQGGPWTTASGEDWLEPEWADAADGQIAHGALLFLPGRGWTAQDASTQMDGFIIEWSDTRMTALAAAGPSTTESDDDTADHPGIPLRDRARQLVIAAENKRSESLRENIRSLTWDLDSWARTLPLGEQTNWAPHITAIKELAAEGNRVPEAIPDTSAIQLSATMARAAEAAAARQAEADAAFLAEAERIRAFFLSNLATEAATAREEGRIEIARAIDAMAAEAADVAEWLEGFGITGQPENPVAPDAPPPPPVRRRSLLDGF